jgi:hypothetical protein
LERRSIYRKAGARFIEGLCGSAGSMQEGGTVTLVAEALAAARFGIQDYISNNLIGGGNEKKTFIALDIGAGTYDVAVVETIVTPTGPIDWKVKSHFGVAIGGNDLDSALAEYVANVLQQAARRTEINSRFDFQLDLPRSRSDLERIKDREARNAGAHFVSELQAAKARLTEALLAAQPGSYEWRSRAEGGPAFDMRVGVLGSETSWPVRLNAKAATPPDAAAWLIPETNAALVFERGATGASIRLKLSCEAFADVTRRDNLLENLIQLMGHELPRLAWIEYDRTAPSDRLDAPVWIITGRAALWPPLFGAIVRSIPQFSPKSGTLGRPRPFSPDEMKQAVVRGAIQLASEPWADADYAVYNPIAAITYKLRTSFSGESSASRAIAEIVRVHDTTEPRSQRTIEIRDPFVIARIMPGLDDQNGREARLQLFNKVGIEPWVELAEVPSDPHRGSKTRWTVTTRRDLSGLFLTFDPGDGSGKPIVFGPFKEGRIYGAG